MQGENFVTEPKAASPTHVVESGGIQPYVSATYTRTQLIGVGMAQ